MTTSDFDKPEFEVKIFFKALKKVKVTAEDRASAHKIAYNNFLDSNPKEIFSDSEIADFFIETSIDGEEGSDMLHE
tara:strand:+ start:1404 stop:1631 length:228 start_codon:yes stop_codon:yes gene_type:complete